MPDDRDVADALEEPNNATVNKSNLGNKSELASRYSRHGKLAAWSPMMEEDVSDRHIRKRLAVCVDELIPDAAADVDLDIPSNVRRRLERRREQATRGKKRERDFILGHLRSPSPPLTADELAPMLAVPQTYLDIMTSPSMRHTLGDDTVEQGLQRTAGELLESEKPLLQSLGKLRDMLRLRMNDVAGSDDEYKPQNAPPIDKMPEAERIPELPNVHETDNLWRVQQDLLQVENPPNITYSASDPSQVPERRADERMPTAVQRLFVVADGITLSAVPSASTCTPGVPALGTRYNINLSQQITAVDDALERISELLADCNEYKERLEEARNRVANVARARKRVWGVIRERAAAELDRLDDRDVSTKELPPRLL